jgi:hypothetical protein
LYGICVIQLCRRPDAYIESSYRGHKAIPERYTVTLKMGKQKITTDAEILANPLYPTDAATYKEYNTIMSSMENELTTMHKMVNSMNAKREQLVSLLASLSDTKYTALKAEGDSLAKKMKAWDEDMIQRKTKCMMMPIISRQNLRLTICSLSIKRRVTFQG